MPKDRFTVSLCRPIPRLFDGDAELLAGPEDELRAFAAALNADPPPDSGLVARVWGLIQGTRDCGFGVGDRLLALGWTAVVPTAAPPEAPAGRRRGTGTAAAVVP